MSRTFNTDAVASQFTLTKTSDDESSLTGQDFEEVITALLHTPPPDKD